MIPRGIMLSGLSIVKPYRLIVPDPLLHKGIIPSTSNMKCVLSTVLWSGRIKCNIKKRPALLAIFWPPGRSLIIVGSLLYERLAT